jgi:hypothetical protein
MFLVTCISALAKLVALTWNAHTKALASAEQSFVELRCALDDFRKEANDSLKTTICSDPVRNVVVQPRVHAASTPLTGLPQPCRPINARSNMIKPVFSAIVALFPTYMRFVRTPTPSGFKLTLELRWS